MAQKEIEEERLKKNGENRKRREGWYEYKSARRETETEIETEREREINNKTKANWFL